MSMLTSGATVKQVLGVAVLGMVCLLVGFNYSHFYGQGRLHDDDQVERLRQRGSAGDASCDGGELVKLRARVSSLLASRSMDGLLV